MDQTMWVHVLLCCVGWVRLGEGSWFPRWEWSLGCDAGSGSGWGVRSAACWEMGCCDPAPLVWSPVCSLLSPRGCCRTHGQRSWPLTFNPVKLYCQRFELYSLSIISFSIMSFCLYFLSSICFFSVFLLFHTSSYMSFYMYFHLSFYVSSI